MPVSYKAHLEERPICARCLVRVAERVRGYWKRRKTGERVQYKNWRYRKLCTQCRRPDKLPYRKDLRTRLGLTTEEFERLCAAQDNTCLICREKCADLVADHCHKSNKFRGILCRKCNVLLGMAGESVEVLARAIEYLKVHQPTTS